MTQLFEPILESQKSEILKSFNTTLEIVKNDVASLREWLKKQPHLPETSDVLIESFLTMSKFSVEEAKKKIDAFYTERNRLGEYLNTKILNPNSPSLMKYADINYYIPLPKLTDDLCRVIVCKFNEDSDFFNLTDSFIWGFAVSAIRLFEDYTVTNVIIYDMSKCNLGHLAKFSPSSLKIFQKLNKTLLCRSIKAVHFIHSSSIIDSVLRIFKVVVNPKTVQRVVVHNDLESLHKNVPKSILPKDYGGEEKSLEELNAIVKKKITEYKDYFDHLDSLKVDENLRPEKLVDDDILGFHGNFKKLDLD